MVAAAGLVSCVDVPGYGYGGGYYREPAPRPYYDDHHHDHHDHHERTRTYNGHLQFWENGRWVHHYKQCPKCHYR